MTFESNEIFKRRYTYNSKQKILYNAFVNINVIPVKIMLQITESSVNS